MTKSSATNARNKRKGELGARAWRTKKSDGDGELRRGSTSSGPSRQFHATTYDWLV
jgi:hypothetical protein